MIDNSEPKAPDNLDLERLLFRRQFFLGPNQFMPNQHWSCIQLHRGFYLSVHNDLPATTTSQEYVTVTLIGHAIDPYHPLLTEPDILQSLVSKTSGLKSLIDSSMPLVGRWIIIFQDHQGTYLFTDPCGFRQVFYYSDGQQVWCASQPELIRVNQPMLLNTDDNWVRFLLDPRHSQRESAWVGPKTLYESCFHLMPNHYLSLNPPEQHRFYPSYFLHNRDTPEIVESACAILQGTMTALATRYDVALALTAGWDTRVLLSASRHVSENLEYYVYSRSNFTHRHPDTWVSSRIANKLGIRFVVKRPVDELPGWFVFLLSQNVTCARVLPKTRHIYDKLISGDNRININGNGSEICRNYFDKYCKLDKRNVSAAELFYRMFGGVRLPSFAIHELNDWKEGIDYHAVENLNILDLLYWEQRLGNWGAQYPAEQDISVEEISPYNCRLLIETLLSSSRHMRSAPDYSIYRELIQHMWPEALSFPINPPPKRRGLSVL